uniref:Uncharacterized protein n=1 Tax=Micrurus corallinus TaxID=54390 RepID=A0A2D4G366_MICCO
MALEVARVGEFLSTVLALVGHGAVRFGLCPVAVRPRAQQPGLSRVLLPRVGASRLEVLGDAAVGQQGRFGLLGHLAVALRLGRWVFLLFAPFQLHLHLRRDFQHWKVSLPGLRGRSGDGSALFVGGEAELQLLRRSLSPRVECCACVWPWSSLTPFRRYHVLQVLCRMGHFGWLEAARGDWLLLLPGGFQLHFVPDIGCFLLPSHCGDLQANWGREGPQRAAGVDDLLHLKEAAHGHDVLHVLRAEGQLGCVHEFQHLLQTCGIADVQVHHVLLVHEEHPEVFAAGRQHRLMGLEVDAVHHEGAVAQQAQLPLLVQLFQDLVAVLREVHGCHPTSVTSSRRRRRSR